MAIATLEAPHLEDDELEATPLGSEAQSEITRRTRAAMKFDGIVDELPIGEFYYDSEAGWQDPAIVVTPEEVSMLVAEGVKRDISRDDIEYPPQAEQILMLANDFYMTYLADTNVDRVEIIDRYMTGLIDALEAQHGEGFHFDESGIALMVDTVHELYDAQPAQRDYAFAA